MPSSLPLINPSGRHSHEFSDPRVSSRRRRFRPLRRRRSHGKCINPVCSRSRIHALRLQFVADPILFSLCRSRRTRPSVSRRSWRRSSARTAPSPTGSACAPTIPSGSRIPSLRSLIALVGSRFPSLVSDWGSYSCVRYNAKRRHWRRTKLGF
jgi:ribosomal protein L39E